MSVCEAFVSACRVDPIENNCADVDSTQQLLWPPTFVSSCGGLDRSVRHLTYTSVFQTERAENLRCAVEILSLSHIKMSRGLNVKLNIFRLKEEFSLTQIKVGCPSRKRLIIHLMAASLFTNKTWSLSAGVMGKTHEILMADKSRVQKLVAYLVRWQRITLPHTDVKWFQTLEGFSSAWSRHHWRIFGWNQQRPFVQTALEPLYASTDAAQTLVCALLFLIYYIFLSYVVFSVFVKLGVVLGCTASCFVWFAGSLVSST